MLATSPGCMISVDWLLVPSEAMSKGEMVVWGFYRGWDGKVSVLYIFAGNGDGCEDRDSSDSIQDSLKSITNEWQLILAGFSAWFEIMFLDPPIGIFLL